MATNFIPCKGSYVLNQFPSNVMFGMNGFHVSASGAIQGHHGPLVVLVTMFSETMKHPSYFIGIKTVNSLPNNKFLNLSKLKAFVDNKINLNESFEFVLGRV